MRARRSSPLGRRAAAFGGPWLTLCFAIGVSLLAHACQRQPAEYARARAAALRAYSSGRYEEAAEKWLDAARGAKSHRDASEARYRAAASYNRAGMDAEAEQLLAALARDPAAERSARADFDRAALVIAGGDEARGYALLRDAVERHPDSGVAPAALTRWLRWLERTEGSAAKLAYLSRALRSLAGSELEEYLRYARARELDDGGRTEAARDEYLKLADRFPYPEGALWDDALFRAAEAEGRLGRWPEAVRLLERMLREREKSPRKLGSYERARFAQARFRIAEIQRDELDQPELARQSFMKLFDEHRTSRLRDDALWQAALLARARGDEPGSCAILRLLRAELPDSRFAPCAPVVCAKLAAMPGRSCRRYIAEQARRRLGSSLVAEPPRGEDHRAR